MLVSKFLGYERTLKMKQFVQKVDSWKILRKLSPILFSAKKLFHF